MSAVKSQYKNQRLFRPGKQRRQQHLLEVSIRRDRERAIAHIFDASYRFTHPLAIQHDADLPRDLVEARLGAVILAIQKVLRTGTL